MPGSAWISQSHGLRLMLLCPTPRRSRHAKRAGPRKISPSHPQVSFPIMPPSPGGVSGGWHAPGRGEVGERERGTRRGFRLSHPQIRVPHQPPKDPKWQSPTGSAAQKQPQAHSDLSPANQIKPAFAHSETPPSRLLPKLASPATFGSSKPASTACNRFDGLHRQTDLQPLGPH